MTLEHRPATPNPITYPEFVNALLTGDASSAIEEVRGLRSTEPSNILLNDFYLYRLAYSLLYTWGLSDEAMQISKLNVELNPSSTPALRMLGGSYRQRGDYPAAIEAYRSLLEMNPDDNGAKRALELIQSQQEPSSRNCQFLVLLEQVN